MWSQSLPNPCNVKELRKTPQNNRVKEPGYLYLSLLHQCPQGMQESVHSYTKNKEIHTPHPQPISTSRTRDARENHDLCSFECEWW